MASFCNSTLYFSFPQLQLKLLTSSIFKGKKDSYPQSISQPFVDTRISKSYTYPHRAIVLWAVSSVNDHLMSLGEQDINLRVLQMIRNEHIKVNVTLHLKETHHHIQHSSPWFILWLRSTASLWSNTIETVSNRGHGRSSSPRPLPMWWRKPRSSRECCTPSSKVRTTW